MTDGVGDPIVAIDGPSGSGKSTVARGVATRLGYDVLDTGAMYRVVTLLVLDGGVEPDDGAAAAKLAEAMDLELGESTRVDGRDVSAAIRGPEVTAAVSTVSAHPAVRAVLVARQRAWVAQRGGGVVEGRDIGTVVFPDARVKVYLTASDEERARRRQRDEHAADRRVEVDSVHADLARRDAIDSNRKVSPLQAAPDALVLDTTGRAVDAVVDEIVARWDAAGRTA
ncbi:MAG TPA: (d)CMP kinase [Acidimicrobiia bacterium]|jgi:cytidylate kinase|nr:(d)CMP kinase [Acidimicrobiia bacterium]